MVHSYGMKVMLTLFHHSLPPWAGAYGGWKLEKTVDYFVYFTRLGINLNILVHVIMMPFRVMLPVFPVLSFCRLYLGPISLWSPKFQVFVCYNRMMS